MPQMTPAQARVVDPILTEVARGYRNGQFVGDALFPAVPVGQRGGRIIQFGKEHFRLYNTARAPGSAVKRITASYSDQPYALTQHAVAEGVPYELMDEANAVPGIDLGRNAVRRGQDIIGLRLEKAQADLACDPARYDAAHQAALSGASQWSDLTGSNPIGDIEDAKDQVRSRIGRYPNTLVLGARVMKSLRQHGKIIDRIKYTGRDVPTPELLASLFGVERVVVGDAVWADEAGNLADVWGRNVVLAYTATGSLDAALPSYGYTYRLGGYPLVERPYQDDGTRSWVYTVIDESEPVIAGAEAGFLLTNVVA